MTSVAPTASLADAGRYRALFVASAAAWGGLAVGWPASAPLLPLFVGGPALLAAILSFDRDKQLGRRKVRRALVLAPEGGSGDYRSLPGLHVEVDGQEVPADESTRLALVRWVDAPAGGGGGTRFPRAELSLVSGRHVYVLGGHSDREPYPEQPEAPAQVGETGASAVQPTEGTAREWEVTSVRGLATAIAQATNGRLRVDPALFTASARWKATTKTLNELPSGLLVIAWFAAVSVGSCGLNQSPPTWTEGAYLGLFVLVTLPLPMLFHAARQARSARAMLQRAYGDVEPLPGGTRLSPGAAFLLAVGMPVVLGFGWWMLFPEATAWLKTP